MQDNKNNSENLDEEHVSKVGGVPDAADDKGVDETMGETSKNERLSDLEAGEKESVDSEETMEDVHVGNLTAKIA